ncbi:MAG: biopolymer transporter ExbD [Pirellulaceae bacterium]|nr:biopolymer transporter ExbD [Pirellulaceae bacterium]
MKTSYSLSNGKPVRSRRPVEIAMTPMIDVIFLLLIFFLATSSFRLVEQLLPSGISQMQSTGGPDSMPPPDVPPEAVHQVVVKLDWQLEALTVSLNGQRLREFADLRSHFLQIAQVQVAVPVVIDPSPDTPAQVVVEAYDWARTAGLPQVYLAIRSTKP